MIPPQISFHGLRYYMRYRLGLRPAFTSTTENERASLARFATDKTRLVEIGVYHGANTLRFRQVMHGTGVVIAVDPYYRAFWGILGAGWDRRIARREVNKCSRGAVIWVETLGRDAPLHPQVKTRLPVDFIFIDGDHSWDGIKGDWLAWRGHISGGGIVALHDSINSGRCGSERFTHEVILADPEFELLETVDTLTVVQKCT